MLRGYFAGALLVVGCGGSVSVDKTEQSGQTSQRAQQGQTSAQAGANDASVCTYPAGVQAASLDADAGSSPITACVAGPPNKICQVDGTTTTCRPLCADSNFELTCSTLGSTNAQPIPSPDASLKCDIIPVPTPSNVLFYCCPCAG